MEKEIKNLIVKFKDKNTEINLKIKNLRLNQQYEHTVLVHTYNNNIEFIKELEKILTTNY